MCDFSKIRSLQIYSKKVWTYLNQEDFIELNYILIDSIVDVTCHACTCKIGTQDSRGHLAAMVFLLSKCDISNLDIIADQDQMWHLLLSVKLL
jgi:hypothetical protein